jgi:hypothetical protein
VWILAMRTFWGVQMTFEEGTTASLTAVPESLMWAGWAFVGGLSQLVVWPLAYYFRKLPIVRGTL